MQAVAEVLYMGTPTRPCGARGWLPATQSWLLQQGGELCQRAGAMVLCPTRSGRGQYRRQRKGERSDARASAAVVANLSRVRLEIRVPKGVAARGAVTAAAALLAAAAA